MRFINSTWIPGTHIPVSGFWPSFGELFGTKTEDIHRYELILFQASHTFFDHLSPKKTFPCPLFVTFPFPSWRSTSQWFLVVNSHCSQTSYTVTLLEKNTTCCKMAAINEVVFLLRLAFFIASKFPKGFLGSFFKQTVFKKVSRWSGWWSQTCSLFGGSGKRCSTSTNMLQLVWEEQPPVGRN